MLLFYIFELLSFQNSTMPANHNEDVPEQGGSTKNHHHIIAVDEPTQVRYMNLMSVYCLAFCYRNHIYISAEHLVLEIDMRSRSLATTTSVVNLQSLSIRIRMCTLGIVSLGRQLGCQSSSSAWLATSNFFNYI